VFKEKYFSEGDFLSSSLGAKPSYAWRSIWGSKQLLRDDIMWRIGDGSNIKIMGDKWLPITFSHKIQIPILGINPEAKVSDSIDFTLNWWNLLVVEQLFPANIVEQICSIVISPRCMQDWVIWVGTNTGHFSIKSAYHLEIERQSSSQGNNFSAALATPLWKKLWELHLPWNVLLFLWRACNEILPTKYNLCRRRIVDDPLYPMCGTEAESTVHAIWSCEAAKAVWNESPVRI